MGYQLWTSPITGYRRKGTKFQSIKKLFTDNITAQCIYEPLLSCPINSNSSHAKRTLEVRDFDIAGVKKTLDGPIVGYVKTNEIGNELFETYIKPIDLGCVVAESTPIADLINEFNDKEFLFVLKGSKIHGILTKADLNKPPVRIYLFGLVSLFEMHLNSWINQIYPDESWKGSISNRRTEAAKDIFDIRKCNNLELSLLECLQFCDKRDILLKSKEFLTEFNFSKSTFEKFLRNTEKIRNELAHSQYSVIANIKFIKLVSTLSSIEIFLESSDAKIEEKAIAGTDFQDLLI